MFTNRARVCLAVAATFAVLFATSPAAFADRSCTAAERTAADRQLWLNDADHARSIDDNLLWGEPVLTGDDTQNEFVLTQRNYVIGYDGDLRIPTWTAHRIRASGLGRVERINCFRRDARLDRPFASYTTDYEEPLFDQGHLTPNGDMSFGKYAVENSFIMSNMAPQYCQFNRGVWQILETLGRFWAHRDGELYVIAGSIVDRDGSPGRDGDDDAWRMHSNNGDENVAIPSAFFKILARPSENGRFEALTLILPHDRTDLDGQAAIDYLNQHVRSIAEVEALTGLDIVDENSVDEADAIWSTQGASFSSLVYAPCRAVTDMR